ncbi:MAG: hypothetical protein RRE21_04345 [Desulfurococcales archaeon]|nr:hypothetical protein [Desulfurococcales archaeon]
MLEAICFFLRALSREELLEIPKDTILLECRRLVLHGLVSSIFRFTG